MARILLQSCGNMIKEETGRGGVKLASERHLGPIHATEEEEE
jgi:hypothetical protein